MAHILIADDEAPVCTVLQKTVKTAAEDAVIDIVGDGEKALRMLTTSPYDIAILDIYMPNMNGLEVVKTAREKGITTDIVLLTAYATLDLAKEAVRSDVQDFLEKPINVQEVIFTVKKLLKKRYPSANALAQDIDVFLKENACNADFKVADICSHFKISPTYVSKLFKTHIKTSFRQRLAYYRIQEAKQLLASTDFPLYIISEQCGFKTQGRLTETFVRFEKVSPNQFRHFSVEK